MYLYSSVYSSVCSTLYFVEHDYSILDCMIAVDLPVGTYVVAVSGGVDSVALLHLLHEMNRQTGLGHRFIVAHFDHGIRSDSDEDRRHAQRLAEHYGLPFVYEQAALGSGASEATARAARYKFLHSVRRASGARAIITAHHEDDVIETALLNLLRGTGGRGLHSLRSRELVQRPLLNVKKKDLIRYAQANGLVWREDSTNTNTAILRNYVRHRVVADMGVTRRSQVLKHSRRAAELSAEIDAIVTNYLHVQPTINTLNRGSFIELPHAVSREILAAWLRHRAPTVELNKKLLERLVVAAKTGRSGSRVDVASGFRLHLAPKSVTLVDVKAT
jgi:tRNA(Ile)-lysidine synthetase-like protein